MRGKHCNKQKFGKRLSEQKRILAGWSGLNHLSQLKLSLFQLIARF